MISRPGATPKRSRDPSLRDILMVSSDELRIEHYRHEPDGWRIHDLRGQDTLRLQTWALALDLADLYAGVLDTGKAGR
jgi:hypothetical protein